MHLILLAWDVHRPGHLDPAVLALARGITAHGHRAHVVTLGTGPTSTSTIDGVEVSWVAEPPPVLPSPRSAHDLTHVLGVASPTAAAAERVCQRVPVEAVVAVGWQTVWAATSVRASRDLPLVAWLGATVVDRADEALEGDARLAAQAEWWLTYEARRVVAETDRVARTVRQAYRLPRGTVDTVAAAMELPPLREPAPDLVLVAGGHASLSTGIEAAGGRVTRATEDAHRAAVAVVLDPHRRDVALATLAGGVPTVVADVAPLRGLVHQRRTGVRVAPADVAGTVEAVRALLRDPRRRERMGSAARRRIVERHDPHDVARELLEVVAAAVAEEASLHPADPRTLRPLMDRAPALRVVPDGPPNGHHRRGATG